MVCQPVHSENNSSFEIKGFYWMLVEQKCVNVCVPPHSNTKPLSHLLSLCLTQALL